MKDDMTLAREYATRHSEQAFETLVSRHVGLVYSAALRQVRDPVMAEEITQTVFILLARKAGSLSSKTILPGWLYRTTRYVSSTALKTRRRRERREQEALMESTTTETRTDAAWEQLLPLLDEAMTRLRDKDCDALVLRYFQSKSLREVGAALGVNEAAAQKRVGRALEKLRLIFARRGATMTTALVAGAISAHSVQAAPVALAKSVTAAALAKGAVASGSTLTLIKGTLKLMTWTKAKTGVIAGIALLLAGGGSVVIVKQITGHFSGREISARSREVYASLTSYSDTGTVVSEFNGVQSTNIFSLRLARPDFYRVEWGDPNDPAQGVAWCAGEGHFLRAGGVTPERKADLRTALAAATGISGGAAATVPSTFFNLNWGNALKPLPLANKQADEVVVGVDCYVFQGDYGSGPVTLWIGKDDFLIRQVRKSLSDPIRGTITETHANIFVNESYSPEDFAPEAP